MKQVLLRLHILIINENVSMFLIVHQSGTTLQVD